jgi:hypothetical protein
MAWMYGEIRSAERMVPAMGCQYEVDRLLRGQRHEPSEMPVVWGDGAADVEGSDIVEEATVDL